MTQAQIIASWKKGKADAVYFLYGEDEFTKSEFIALALETFLPDFGMRSFNFDQFYGSEGKSVDVVNCASQFPVMADRRMVIVRDAEKLWRSRATAAEPVAKKSSKSSSHEDPILSYIEKPNFDCVLIIETTKPGAKNMHPWKEFFAKTVTLEFPPLKETAVIEWLIARAGKAGRTLDFNAARLVVESVGTDLRTNSSELEKLFAYIGDRSTITEEDVEQAVGISRTFNSFELTKAIGAGNAEKASEIALRMIAEDKSAKYIIVPAIGKYLEQLIVAKEMEREGDQAIAQALGLYGGAAYFVKDYTIAARRYSRAALDTALKSFTQTEFESRIYKMDDTMFFQKLISEIMP